MYLYYHTIAQVVVGGCLGTAFGCVWYYFVNYQFIKYVPFIIEQPLAKYLLIRDYSPIPHIIHFQYENEMNEARCAAWKGAQAVDNADLLLGGVASDTPAVTEIKLHRVPHE